MLKCKKDCLNPHGPIFVIFWDCLLTYWHPMTSILSTQKRVFDTTISNAIISKSKNFFRIFFCISGIYIKVGILWKKRWRSDVICFWSFILQKPKLPKCLKSHVSEHLWTVNILKGPKYCLNPHGSIFFIFFDHSERKSARKNLIY